MIARDIMPSDAIIVDVIKHAHAGFVSTVDVKLGIIRLTDFLVSRRAPRVVSKAIRNLVSRSHLPASCWPKPSKDALGLQIPSPLASLKIAKPSTRPNIRYIIYKKNGAKFLNLNFGGKNIYFAELNGKSYYSLPVFPWRPNPCNIRGRYS